MLKTGQHEAMGAVARESDVTFRVWAPHAKAVFVTGTFNDWSALRR